MKTILRSLNVTALALTCVFGMLMSPATAAEPVNVTVTISTGGELAGAGEARLQIYSYLAPFHRWETINNPASTDEDGVATASLDPGEYRFCFEPEDPRFQTKCLGATWVQDATTVNLVADRDLGSVDLGLKSLAVTSGLQIIGSPVVGERVHVDLNSLIPEPEATDITWVRDPMPALDEGGAVRGEEVGSGPSYRIRGTDLGHTIAAIVDFLGPNVRGPLLRQTNINGLVTYALTPSIGPVMSPVQVPGDPRITARKWRKGKLATYVAAGPLPAEVTAHFQWLRNGQIIAGQTAAAHKITKRDRRKQLSLRVTYSRAGFADTTIVTAPSPRIR